MLLPGKEISQRKPLICKQGAEQGDIPAQWIPQKPSPGSPHPLPPTQLGALLWRGCLLVVGLVGHGAGDAALAPALAVGGFAPFGGDRFFLIVVFSGCVVVLVPAKTGREGKKK